MSATAGAGDAAAFEQELLLAQGPGGAPGGERGPAPRFSPPTGPTFLSAKSLLGAWGASVALSFAGGCVYTAWMHPGPGTDEAVTRAGQRARAQVSDLTLLAEDEHREPDMKFAAPPLQHQPAPPAPPKRQELDHGARREHARNLIFGKPKLPNPKLPNPKFAPKEDKKTSGKGASAPENPDLGMFGTGPVEPSEAKSKEAPPKLWTGWPCKHWEQLFFDKCFIDCDAATGGEFPFRHDSCTCCKNQPCRAGPGESENDCQMYNVNGNGGTPEPPELLNCPQKNEELHDGLCYTRCRDLTDGMYPVRTGMNQCSNGRYGGEWNMGIGPCSGFGIGVGQCLPHIPEPAGVGFKMANAEENKGEPPLGMVPEEAAAVIAKSASASEGTVESNKAKKKL